ncbi:HAD hydrolase-like protein [Hoeflea sp. AS60]|uniref:HAD hydrolase-like protein n=1 Tax=Hoeflea sp. AS60 TaxID=3135780 RepID=UPI00317B3513
MVQTIASSDEFYKICARNDIQVVFLDLRGTLFRAPRKGNIARAAATIGFNDPIIWEIDQRVPSDVISAYRNECGVFDWTLVSVLKFAELARESGILLSLTQCENIYQLIRAEYREQSVPLVADAQLASFVGSLGEMGAAAVIAADGVLSFEQSTFQRLFPETSALGIKIITSDILGINKLAPDFYRLCAQNQGKIPENCLVIGDRMDKDILSGRRAGCRTLLVGDVDEQRLVDAEGPDWKVARFDQIVPDSPRILDGALFGRFQPFHREHLRFIRHAAAHCARLTIGVTNPFLSGAEPFTNDRTRSDKNPLPYWFRKRWILAVLERDGFSLDRFSVVPCPLDSENLTQLFAPDTPAYVTNVEDWSEEKSSLIARAGLRVCNLEVGPKTISGSEIRDLIWANDQRWRSLVPPVSDASLFDEIETLVRAAERIVVNTSVSNP